MGGGNSLAALEKDCYLRGSDSAASEMVDSVASEMVDSAASEMVDSAASEMVENYDCWVACDRVVLESDCCLCASAEIDMGCVGSSAGSLEREVL